MRRFMYLIIILVLLLLLLIYIYIQTRLYQYTITGYMKKRGKKTEIYNYYELKRSLQSIP